MTKDKLLEALPLFIGALLGVWFYYAHTTLWAPSLVVVALAGVGWLAKAKGKRLMPRRPIAAVQVWQAEVLLPIALIGIGGYVSTWIIDQMPTWVPLLFPDQASVAAGTATDAAEAAAEAGAERIKTISATLSTAVTAFLGALFMDDQKDKDGGFWPAAQIRKEMREIFAARVDAMKAALKQEPGEADAVYAARLERDAPAYELASRAIHAEEVTIDHPEGWSYSAAMARAQLVKKYVLKC